MTDLPEPPDRFLLIPPRQQEDRPSCDTKGCMRAAEAFINAGADRDKLCRKCWWENADRAFSTHNDLSKADYLEE